MLPIVCFVLLLCQATGSQVANAGIKVQVSQKGLDYAKEIAVGLLELGLPLIPIPDMQGKHRMAIEVDYTVTKIKMLMFNISAATMTLIPGKGIQMSISNSRAVIQNNWKLKSSLLKDAGSSVLELNGISITAVMNITLNSTGDISVSLSPCTSDVMDVGVQLTGGVKMLNSKMKETMKKLTRERMNTELCSTIRTEIENMTATLNQVGAKINVNSNTTFDYSLVSSPVTTEDEITLPLKGMFYCTNAPEELPFSPAPFTLQGDKDRMICIGVSDAVVNSAANAFFKSGSFALNLDAMLFGEDGLMNATALAAIYPEASKLQNPLEGSLQATKAPRFIFNLNNLTLVVEIAVELSEILPNNVKRSLLSYSMISSISGNFKVSNSGRSYESLNLTGSLTINSFDVHPADSKKHPEGSDGLKSTNPLMKVAEKGLLNLFNDHMMKGILIPRIPYFAIKNPSFEIHKDFIRMCGDVELEAPRL